MKSDLDTLMADRSFDAIVIIGEATENHALTYLTNGANISHATLVKKQDEAPFLVCNPMERDEAAKSGLETFTTTEYGLQKLVKEAGNYFDGETRLLAEIFNRHEITGTVSFYGVMNPGQAFRRLSDLGEQLPDLTITGETEMTLFDEAYATKDSDELDRIKDVAELTNAVMAQTVDFIKGHKASDNQVIKEDGSPLTVGDVKGFLRMRLLEKGLEDGGTTIFAIGRDAGVPHSRGEDSDILELGKSIIFDLFPRELRGGYYHDMTRTFCLGYAPPEVQEAYDQVMHAFHEVLESVTVGQPTGELQSLTCDILEQYGHPTPRTHTGTTEGYVHSIGHGLGLQIHSRPRLNNLSDEVITPGQVITVEPGLYYPDKGYGVRIEDTLYIDEGGVLHSLSPFSKDLVIPIEGAAE